MALAHWIVAFELIAEFERYFFERLFRLCAAEIKPFLVKSREVARGPIGIYGREL
jgi:hypothetical protein